MKEEKIIDFRLRKLVFLDLETTGLNPEVNEIIEVACLVVDGQNYKVLSEYEAKIKPEHIETADPVALKINGYSEEAWKDARPASEVLKKVASIAPGGMLIGWNISFDWLFLDKFFNKFGIKHQFDYHRIDATSVAYPTVVKSAEIKSLSLRKVAPFFGVELPEIHRAIEDTRATYEVIKKIMQDESNLE